MTSFARRALFALLAAAAPFGALVACSLHGTCTPGGDGTYVNESALYGKLSDYCMVSLADGEVVPEVGVVPYDQTTPLFSDYAIKRRTVWLPPGKSATYADSAPFDFPVGTIVTKSFGFAADMRAPAPVHWVETRVLVRATDGWNGASYVWNDDQSEATIKPGGTFIDESFIEPDGTPVTTSYMVPTSNQCVKCHEDMGALVPIGLRASSLNHDYAYASGAENQLSHWQNAGILSGAPASAPALADWTDTTLGADTRARAYLDANCAYCHSATGEARNTGLILAEDVTDPYRLGVCKTPVATGKASSNLYYDVVPGQPDQSILLYRMNQTGASIAMPEIGRSLVHTEGAAIVRDWITGLTGTCTN